jgi:hypothetical protein
LNTARRPFRQRSATLLASWENRGRYKFSVGKNVETNKKKHCQIIGDNGSRPNYKKKEIFFLVATCFCYLLEVTAPKEKKSLFAS